MPVDPPDEDDSSSSGEMVPEVPSAEFQNQVRDEGRRVLARAEEVARAVDSSPSRGIKRTSTEELGPVAKKPSIEEEDDEEDDKEDDEEDAAEEVKEEDTKPAAH